MAAKRGAKKATQKATPKATKKAAAKKPAAKKPVKKAAAKKPAARRAAPPRTAKPTGPSVVHWEVQAKDGARQQQFFADLFGWTVDANNPMGYGMVAGGKDGIAGGIGQAPDAPRVTFYVRVPDINSSLAKAEGL